KSSSLFSFALAAISTAGAVWLLWAIHLLGLSQEAVEVPTGRRQGLGGIGAGALMVQMVGRVCELAVSFGRAIGKVLACVIAGAGTGLVTMGVFALRQPDLWQYEAMQRAGPPLAPLLFGAGVGLLTTEFLLIVLFRRSWFRPAKAVVEASTVRPREGESSSSGGTSGGRHAG
ncbi:MAG: hypothetical protein JO112_23115, partial [Planctomycetes bacterium]|nr:hypothetical protein [Planctomycetota bacterium]